MTILTTQRLRLEPINDSHLEGLCAINGNYEVMRYISGKPETREETIEAIARIKSRWEKWGFSWWVLIEIPGDEIVGAGCIQHLDDEAANPLEIGWRLRPDKWHQGFASEAARQIATLAFETVGTNVLYGVCHPNNFNSLRLMKRLGMQYRGIERWYKKDSVVYAISRSHWQVQQQSLLPTKL